MALHPLERKVLRASRGLLDAAASRPAGAPDVARAPSPGRVVVVGASGGPDSTALLSALVTLARRGALQATIVAAHLDHGLRGDEGRRDRDATRALGERLGVEVVDGVGDALDEARRRGTGSLEAAARAVRYRFLTGVARERGADRVAVGHTADDQAETVLQRVLRGAGLAGLSGMPRRRVLGDHGGAREQARAGLADRGRRSTDGMAFREAGERLRTTHHTDITLVRPLLGVTRAEVEDYLRAAGLDALVVVDGSNADPRFLRNRLRSEVLPLLRAQVNPRVDEALRRVAAQARRARAHLDRAAAALLSEAETPAGWALAPLRAADAAVRDHALLKIVAAHAPDRAAADHVRLLARIVRAGRGRCDLPGGLRLEVTGERLVAVSRAPAAPGSPAAPVDLAVPGEAFDARADLVFEARLAPVSETAAAAAEAAVDVDVDPAEGARLDADLARGALAVRRRRQGDRFWPLGAPGTRSLKRFLIDRKVPRDQRARTPVVTLDDQPVWIVGHRIDERFKVTPATRTVLELQVRAAAGEKGR